MSSIKDVASKAGVSISTVSNVINGSKYVSAQLRCKVEKVIGELDYRANPVARGLKSKRTNMIGVVVQSLTKLFFPMVMSGISDIAAKHGFTVTFYDSHDDLATEKNIIQQLEQSWADGIILDSCAGFGEGEYLQSLSFLGGDAKRIPVVSIENNYLPYCDSVIIDNRQCAFEATEYLIKQGHRDIAHISGPMVYPFSAERTGGYCDAMRAYGLTVNDMWVENGNFLPLSGYSTMKNMLMRGGGFSALFASNDQMAIGAIKAIYESGLSVPDDIAIVGFDNLFVSSILTPGITTVNVPKYLLGSKAAQILIDRILSESDGQAQCVELPAPLIVRQSTNPRAENSWDLHGW